MPELLEAAGRVLRSGRYILGREVEAFEKEMARSCGAGHCIGVSTGLDALRLIFRAYMEMGRLAPGDEVIVPANTFVATFLAVTDCGLTAVAADVDETTFCLDFNRLPISPRTKALVTVHLYGNPCWDAELFLKLHERGILIVEDNAQAIGARSDTPGFHGSALTGNLGDAAAVSFYPAKNIGALGDAGAVLTSDEDLARNVRMLANYGSETKYSHELCGLNCRLDELQAALLMVKLPHLDEISQRRNITAMLYDRLISNPQVTKPAIRLDGAFQVWHQYIIRHPRRDALRSYLKTNGVGTEVHYPLPVHLQPCYQGHPLLRLPEEGLPVATALAGEILSLPIADVSDSDIEEIAVLINNFI